MPEPGTAQDLLSRLRDELTLAVDEHTRQGAIAYFKEPILVFGVRTAAVNAIAREHWPEVKELGKEKALDLCESLLQSAYNEEAFIACDWCARLHPAYQPADFAVFERWIDAYIDNWAKCDTLCNHSVGTFLEMYPGHLPELQRWARSDNRWKRRAAAVSLILPARRGLFLPEIFALADTLLMDQDDLVQKGYGWMLKEASKPHLPEVFAYIERNKAVMPRTALRYAIEKMPDEFRTAAMSKNRSTGPTIT